MRALLIWVLLLVAARIVLAGDPARTSKLSKGDDSSKYTLTIIQDDTQKIIYVKDSEITFTVDGAPDGSEYKWDVNGDGEFAGAPYERGTGKTIIVTISGDADSETNMKLEENVGNRRKDFDFQVSIKAPNADKATIIKRKLRVSLNGNFGDAFPAELHINDNANFPDKSAINRWLKTKYGWNDTTPAQWDTVPAALDATYKSNYNLADSCNSYRLQYADNVDNAVAYTVVHAPEPDHNQGAILAFTALGGLTFDWNVPELTAAVAHEGVHAKQWSDAIHSPNSLWNKMVGQFGWDANPLTEPAGYVASATSDIVSYKFLGKRNNRGHLAAMQSDFEGAWDRLGQVPAGAFRTEMLAHLTAQYQAMTKAFEELKHYGFDHHLNAPPAN